MTSRKESSETCAHLSDEDWLKHIGVQLRLLGHSEKEVARETYAMRSQNWPRIPEMRRYAEDRIRDRRAPTYNRNLKG